MPKLKTFVPYEQEQLEKELRAHYGSFMNTHKISEALGSNYQICKEFLKNVPYCLVGKTKKYRTADVAKRIYDNMVYPGERCI